MNGPWQWLKEVGVKDWKEAEKREERVMVVGVVVVGMGVSGGGGGSSGRHWVSGGGGGSVKDGVSNSRITWRYLQLHRYGF